MADNAGEGEKVKYGTNGEGTGRREGAGALWREVVSAHEDGAEFPREREASWHPVAFMEMGSGKTAGRCVCEIVG